MAKKLKTKVKLQITAGQATAGPPVGNSLGQHGVDIGGFVSQFNEKTRENQGTKVPVIINIYEDRSFDFIVKEPPATILIKKALGIDKGSSSSKKEKVGKLTQSQLEEIAKAKMPDLNANDIEQAKKVIAGTARSMGIEVEK